MPVVTTAENVCTGTIEHAQGPDDRTDPDMW
jgi:hypothetical protein